jgi:four helix bundle protein
MSLPHHNLVVWQRADDLFIETHKLTHKRFPIEEKYELSAQLRRAAYSVPANIVEGTQREHPKESLHFCSIASASLAEVGYGLHASHRLGYLSTDDYEQFELKIRQIAAPLKGLMATYRRGETLATQRKPIPARAKRAHPRRA